MHSLICIPVLNGRVVSQQSELCVFRAQLRLRTFYYEGEKSMSMVALKCPECGADIELDDSREFGFCLYCGTKVMQDKVIVEHQGSVKIDNSDYVQKFLQNARRAKEKEDWEETEKYYNLVEQNDPDNIEAIFYSAYAKAKTTLVDGDIYKRQAAFNVLKNCISIIDDHYKLERREDNKNAIITMAQDLGDMITSSFVYSEWKNGYGVVVRTNKNETYVLFASLLVGFKETIDNIQKIDDQAYLHEALISLISTGLSTNWLSKELLNEWLNEEKKELKVIHEKRISEYWSEHAEEKKKLEEEKQSIENQVNDLNAQIEALPEYIKVKRTEAEIEKNKKEKESLGMFKTKEKKAIQDLIEKLSSELNEANKSFENASLFKKEAIERLKFKIKSIDDELTKDR